MAAAAAAKMQKTTRRSTWSDLPSDLVVSILERLSTVDYIRFGAVCAAWHSIWKQRFCRPAPPHVPWLMMSSAAGVVDAGSDDVARSFFDLATGKTYTMSLPELHGRHCLGTSVDGSWVVYVDGDGDDHELSLLHLATRQRLPLPPLSTVWVVRNVERDREGRPLVYWLQTNRFPRANSLSPEYMFRYFFCKAMVIVSLDGSPGPAGRTPPLVVFVHGSLGAVSVCCPGDEAWTKMECQFGITDVVLHKGRLCAVDFSGNAIAWDPRDPSSSRAPVANWSEPEPLGPAMNHPDFPQKYLVSDGGELWQVWRDVEFTNDPDSDDDPVKYETLAVRAFKLDPAGDRWSEVKNLDGRAFFLGNNYPVVRSGSAGVGGRKNCIYFTDDNLECMLYHEQLQSNDRDIGVYNLEDGSWEPLPLPAGAVVKYPTPIWVTPSL